METQSQVMVEHVLAAEEVSKGAGDPGAVVGDHPCKDLVPVAVPKEQERVTEANTLPATNDDLTIENCAHKLHSLPANGDGDGDGDGHGKAPAADENGTSLGASQADSTEPCEEVAQTVVVAKEQESAPKAIVDLPATNDDMTIENCTQKLHSSPANGDGDGDGNGKAPATTSLPETLLAPEDNEPSWGDVPDDIAQEPILPPRPPKRPRIAPECVEVDDVVQTMRNILFNLTYEDDTHLSPEDEAIVRDLLGYHPKVDEKTGSGIDYIKVKRHGTFKDVRCFWVVRTDGTEIDFSYHKCLKEKVAKEHPSFVDRYDGIYRAPKRPRQG